MYLEYHRGTYTTQAKTKKNNRKGEFLLRDAEILTSIAGLYKKQDKDELYTAWQLLLLNQFHDILPGSSINEVYRDSGKDYEKIFEIGGRIKDNAIDTIIENYKCQE